MTGLQYDKVERPVVVRGGVAGPNPYADMATDLAANREDTARFRIALPTVAPEGQSKAQKDAAVEATEKAQASALQKVQHQLSQAGGAAGVTLRRTVEIVDGAAEFKVWATDKYDRKPRKTEPTA